MSATPIGLLSLPLVSTLALHPSQPLKAWAGHVHAALCPAPDTIRPAKVSQPAASESAALHGLPCLVQEASNQLDRMWHFDLPTQQQKAAHADDTSKPQTGQGLRHPAVVWLGRFEKALQNIKAADKEAEQGQEKLLSSQQDEVVRMILTALLDHPQLEVQAAAARTIAEAVQALPISGMSLLPLLIYKLQHSVAVTQQGE